MRFSSRESTEQAPWNSALAQASNRPIEERLRMFSAILLLH